MPIHEYVCQECGRHSDHLRGLKSNEPEPVCPHCGSQELERQPLTTFAVHGGGRRSRQAEGSLCCGRDSRPDDCVPGTCCGHAGEV